MTGIVIDFSEAGRRMKELSAGGKAVESDFLEDAAKVSLIALTTGHPDLMRAEFARGLEFFSSLLTARIQDLSERGASVDFSDTSDPRGALLLEEMHTASGGLAVLSAMYRAIAVSAPPDSAKDADQLATEFAMIHQCLVEEVCDALARRAAT